MNQLINSFATSAYRIMTVKRLDKVRNTTVLTSVCRNELIHLVHDRQLRVLGRMLRNTLSTCQYLCTISANSRHNKTRPSSTKLHGLYRDAADWNEDQRTRGGVTRPWSLAWTCGRVCWSTTVRLERERGEREIINTLIRFFWQDLTLRWIYNATVCWWYRPGSDFG